MTLYNIKRKRAMLEITFNKQFFSHVFKNVRPWQTDQPQKHMHVKWLHAKFHLQLQFSNENMRILLSAAIFKSRLQ